MRWKLELERGLLDVDWIWIDGRSPTSSAEWFLFVVYNLKSFVVTEYAGGNVRTSGTRSDTGKENRVRTSRTQLQESIVIESHFETNFRRLIHCIRDALWGLPWARSEVDRVVERLRRPNQ